MRPKRILIMIVLIFLSCILSAGENESIDDLFFKIDAAVADKSYTKAISLLEQAKKMYPENYLVPFKAGKLYKERSLYRLALGEFLSADSLNPGNPDILFEIAGTYGYLGENAESVNVLENLLELDPPEYHREIIDELSWMYFKTYRMEDGINLLEKELSENFDRYLAHTLGTLYSAVYNLEKSRYWYQRSIDDAVSDGDEYFASIAHYNLALLYFTFYRYKEARAETLASLELRSRTGGYLILGELDFMEWKIKEAYNNYFLALSKDSTPLAETDMADFMQRLGYLDESINYMEKIKDNPDISWMYNFGVDQTRFNMDVYRILSESWKGKANVERLTVKTGLFRRIESWFKSLYWEIKGLYYGRLNRKYTLKYAEELDKEKNYLDAYWNYAKGSRGYKKTALKYLLSASDIETEIMPESEPWYKMETGREKKDPQLLLSAIRQFQPEEKDPLEQTYRYIALSGNKKSFLKDSRFSALLYKINPGGLRQYGLSLPVSVKVAGFSDKSEGMRLKRKITGLLKRTGYTVVKNNRENGFLSILTVSSGPEGKIKWFFADPDGITRITAESGTDALSGRKKTAEILNGLLESFYNVNIETGVSR